MSVTIDIKLRPFTVPNFVSIEMPARPKQDGFIELPKYALHELPDETLERLCAEFREAVLQKARTARNTGDES